MRVYKAALIGCGKIGSEFALDPRVRGTYTHAGAFAGSPRTMLAAICDSDPQRLAACGDHWKVTQRFANAGEMLAAVRPDIVSICSPDATHAEMFELSLDNGVRAIIAEKPVAPDAEIAAALVAKASRLGVVVLVNYTRRYAAGHARVRDMISRGELGQIRAVTGYYTKGVKHNGTHWFDLARFLFGEVADVRAEDFLSDGSADPTLDVQLRFVNGARGTLLGCGPAFSIFEMDVIGTRGRVRIVDSGHTIERYDVADSPHYSGYTALRLLDTWAGGLDDAMVHLVENCVACLDSGSTAICSGQDGVAALEIADAACVSVEEQRRIPLK